MKKTNWAAVGVVVLVLLAWIGWENTQERRIRELHTAADLAERLQNLETLLTPLLVDWRVHQLTGHKHELRAPTVDPPPILPYPEPETQIREEAQSWADDRIKQYKR